MKSCCDSAQSSGRRFCLHADLTWGTKAADKTGSARAAASRPGRFTPPRRAPARLCKYFPGQRRFSNRTPSPLPRTRQQAPRAVCRVRDRWPGWSGRSRPGFPRPSVRKVSAPEVVRVSAGEPEPCRLHQPSSRGRRCAMRGWACSNAWVPSVSLQGVLEKSPEGWSVYSSPCFASPRKRCVRWCIRRAAGATQLPGIKT